MRGSGKKRGDELRRTMSISEGSSGECGRPGARARKSTPGGEGMLRAYMADCRSIVIEQLMRFVPSRRRAGSELYDLVLDYPLREAKALRPALCIASCRAVGGQLEAVATSATVLELYHNAFLVHDDVEDGSECRRAGPTLHRVHGVPVAVNVGDAMLALALPPLLENTRILSLGKALRVFECVARMARESAEGQALELALIKAQNFSLRDREYFRLVHKKTSHYSFIAPILIGGIVGGGTDAELTAWARFATLLGVAFQLQDDLLNLTGTEERLGKEIDGDLWEGKHTLILIHAIRTAKPSDRRRALAILQKDRPREADVARMGHLRLLVAKLRAEGAASPVLVEQLACAVEAEAGRGTKSPEEVAFLRELIARQGSVEYARAVARRWAGRARSSLQQMGWLKPSVHRDFLVELTDFVVQRQH